MAFGSPQGFSSNFERNGSLGLTDLESPYLECLGPERNSAISVSLGLRQWIKSGKPYLTGSPRVRNYL